jgi:hypothetical protein
MVAYPDGRGEHRDAVKPGLAVAAAVTVASTLTLLPGVAAAQSPTTMTAEQLRQALQAGTPIEATGLRIVGTLDLRPLGEVTQSLRCEGCVVTGGVLATDVTFVRSVDLDGIRIEGDVDLRGAVFQGPVLIRGDTEAAGFAGTADFSFATFEDTASMDGLRFGGRAVFTGARFDGDASFSGSSFAGEASFDQARFQDLVSFNGRRDRREDAPPARFEGPASFRASVFSQTADFALRSYDGGLDLAGAVFSEPMSVFGSEVSGLLNAKGAAFAALDARALLTAGTADFSQARAGSASFDSAIMNGDLVLNELAVTGTTSLRELELTGQLAMTRFLTGQLDMAIPLVDKVIGRPAQEAVLARIEATARAQKNNAKANEAEFRLLSLRGEAESGLSRVVDLVLYQWIAGYLVRPSHPLTALALLVLAGTIVRIVWRARSDRERSKGLDTG